MCTIRVIVLHAFIYIILVLYVDCNELKVLNWNIMGECYGGWAKARSKIVQHNIQGYDVVFLQEVQWVEEGTKERLAAGYEVVMESSQHNNRNTCILYNSDRLQHEDDYTDTVTKTLLRGWTEHYSKRLCVKVFSLRGKGDTSKFVAISLHAPKKTEDNHSFCDLVKAGIEKVVADHKLPVLVGGDFNSDIHRWEDDGFQSLNYDAGRSPIDFITMKFPRQNNHLTIGMVQKIKRDNITIPPDAEDIMVELKKSLKMKVKECKVKAVDKFYQHLCGYHMPLTVVVTYSDDVILNEGDDDETKSREELMEEIARLTEELRKMKSKMKEMEKQYQAEIANLKGKVKHES